jgi:ABC-type transport system substrate-binding protein
MAAQIIQGQLMEVGINVEIVATDTGNYTASSQSGNYDMMIAMTSSSLYDVSSTNTEYRIQDTTGPIWPLADELDALCAKANVEVDPDARKALTAEVYTIVQENAYTVGLYGSESTMAYNKNLEGITLNPNNAWRVYNWSWK